VSTRLAKSETCEKGRDRCGRACDPVRGIRRQRQQCCHRYRIGHPRQLVIAERSNGPLRKRLYVLHLAPIHSIAERVHRTSVTRDTAWKGIVHARELETMEDG